MKKGMLLTLCLSLFAQTGFGERTFYKLTVKGEITFILAKPDLACLESQWESPLGPDCVWYYDDPIYSTEMWSSRKYGDWYEVRLETFSWVGNDALRIVTGYIYGKDVDVKTEVRNAPPFEPFPPVRLRSTPAALTQYDLKRMKALWGIQDESSLNAHSFSFSHDYEPKTIARDPVVIDHATGLMWHPSGSNEFMDYDRAQAWIEKLNRAGYAGYNNWRIPTLEEAATLFEPFPKSKTDYEEVHLDPLFAPNRTVFWTCDEAETAGSGKMWFVNIPDMYMFDRSKTCGVKPVRSIPGVQYSTPKPPGALRAEPTNLTEDDVNYMILKRDFYDRTLNKDARGIPHDYESKAVGDARYTIDNATDLIWAPLVPQKLTRGDAEIVAIRMNKVKAAGYSKWRLPTLEEAMSIVEYKKEYGYQLDPVFIQPGADIAGSIWTSDSYIDYLKENKQAAKVFIHGSYPWPVFFDPEKDDINLGKSCFMLVCSIKQNREEEIFCGENGDPRPGPHPFKPVQ